MTYVDDEVEEIVRVQWIDSLILKLGRVATTVKLEEQMIRRQTIACTRNDLEPRITVVETEEFYFSFRRPNDGHDLASG